MRITFLRPHMMHARSGDAMEPLAFAVLAGLTPPDVELDFFDERLEDLPLDHATDLVAITLTTYTARRSYQVASHFRKRGIQVVLGGYHPTFLPEEALNYADAVVVGDAEEVWPQVVEDARQHKLQRIYKSEKQLPLDGLHFDRSIFAGKHYKPLVPVQFGRGCHFACDFCSIRSFYGSHTRQRPIHEVVAEIEALGARYILFIDDNLFSERQKTLELFAAITPLKIKWTCQISIDVAFDNVLLKAMSRSGCIAAIVGFESLSDDNLHTMRKSWAHKKGSYVEAIRKFQEHGILLWGSFVFGYDQDTLDTFDRTIEFAIASKMTLVNFTAITPMPGTTLYQRFQKDERLFFARWWLDPAYQYGQAVFQPKNMTPEQLAEGCVRARSAFYSYSSMFKRSLDWQCNSSSPDRILFFWTANLLFKSELSRKMGQILGSSEPLYPAVESLPVLG